MSTEKTEIRQPIRFEFSAEESEAARAFLREHHHCAAHAGAIGGAISYVLTPTSLGTSLVVACAGCKGDLDVTDYGSW